jgi:recombination protein RecR
MELPGDVLTVSYPKPLRRLITLLSKLPGIGEKTGTRLALHLLKMPRESLRELGQAIAGISEAVIRCTRCCNIADADPCTLCADPARRDNLICVVEDPTDIVPIEKSGEHKGRYHVLGGAISPIDGVMPEDLRIRELLGRIAQGGIEEVILATNLTAEGEATASYLAGVLKPLGVRVTRIAYGMPVGSDLEYTDEVTVGRAIKGRRDV